MTPALFSFLVALMGRYFRIGVIFTWVVIVESGITHQRYQSSNEV